MPSKSKAMQHFMGAELTRKRAGKATETGMSEEQLRDFAATKTAKLPEHAHKGMHGRGATSKHAPFGRKPNPRGAS